MKCCSSVGNEFCTTSYECPANKQCVKQEAPDFFNCRVGISFNLIRQTEFKQYICLRRQINKTNWPSSVLVGRLNGIIRAVGGPKLNRWGPYQVILSRAAFHFQILRQEKKTSEVNSYEHFYLKMQILCQNLRVSSVNNIQNAKVRFYQEVCVLMLKFSTASFPCMFEHSSFERLAWPSFDASVQLRAIIIKVMSLKFRLVLSSGVAKIPE